MPYVAFSPRIRREDNSPRRLRSPISEAKEIHDFEEREDDVIYELPDLKQWEMRNSYSVGKATGRKSDFDSEINSCLMLT